ncbi:hypothetical protein GJ496_000221 [Pomphorhynchus laevis]|nr:hypothetical protein GJ496_000221 [Pomphorhynchus laevis]
MAENNQPNTSGNPRKIRRGIPESYIQKAITGMNVHHNELEINRLTLVEVNEPKRQAFFNEGDGTGFLPISADMVDATSLPQRYPPTLPQEKIKIAYHDTGLTAVEVFTLAEESLRCGIMPHISVVTHCIAYIVDQLKFPAKFTGKIGSLRKWQSGEISITDIFEFQPTDCAPVTPPLSPKHYADIPFLAIIVYLLLNVRMGKLDPRLFLSLKPALTMLRAWQQI